MLRFITFITFLFRSIICKIIQDIQLQRIEKVLWNLRRGWMVEDK